MKCGKEYWIWLQSALGPGAKTADLLNFYKTPEHVYNAVSVKKSDVLINEPKRRKLVSVSPSESYPILKRCAEEGWHIITPDCEEFPESMYRLDNFPLVLYVKGDPSVLRETFCIGFVGTRQASSYGRQAAEQLSFAVASAGAVVVSGCAVGIDSCAHLGALEAKGRTIGFLGTGLDADYPKENRSLREAIARNGALITEYPPNSRVGRSNFPIRNRLIAALSLGTVVVEAGVKSGAMITANDALNLGKDVFAVPGEITNSSFTGCNNLIRDGAKPAFTAVDILEEYAYLYGDSPAFQQAVAAPVPLTGRHTPTPVERGASDGKKPQTMRSKNAAPPEKKTAQTAVPTGAKPPVRSDGRQPMNARREQTERIKKEPSGNTKKEPSAAVQREPSEGAQKGTSKPAKRELPAYIDSFGREVYRCLSEHPGAAAEEIADVLGQTTAAVLAALTALELANIVDKSGGAYRIL